MRYAASFVFTLLSTIRAIVRATAMCLFRVFALMSGKVTYTYTCMHGMTVMYIRTYIHKRKCAVLNQQVQPMHIGSASASYWTHHVTVR